MVTPNSIIPYKYLFSESFIRQLFEGETVSFRVDGDFFVVPADALECPQALSRLVAAHQPALHENQYATESGLVHCWQHILTAEWHRSPIHTITTARNNKHLPALVETALQVHMLGLEPLFLTPILSQAADQFLMAEIATNTDLLTQDNGLAWIHSALVNVIAKSLRPWSFQAPSLTVSERVILIYLLADLSTSKAKKLLHAEKKHAQRHAMPEVINNATNRALRRWHHQNLSLTPQQHILRFAATMRYLNRVRRAQEPASIDTEVVMDLVRNAK